jgi:hypothetical protein
MPWQYIMAGFVVAAAGAYVFWRLRRKRTRRRSQGPDVPVSRLTQKRPLDAKAPAARFVRALSAMTTLI